MSNDIKLWGGGVGEKKSNRNTQYYLQNRIYDANGLSPSLTSVQFYVIIFEEEDESEE